MGNYIARWRDCATSLTGNRPGSGNKLRTYRLFKNDYGADSYIKFNLINRQQRSVGEPVWRH